MHSSHVKSAEARAAAAEAELGLLKSTAALAEPSAARRAAPSGVDTVSLRMARLAELQRTLLKQFAVAMI